MQNINNAAEPRGPTGSGGAGGITRPIARGERVIK